MDKIRSDDAEPGGGIELQTLCLLLLLLLLLLLRKKATRPKREQLFVGNSYERQSKPAFREAHVFNTK